MIFNSLKTFYKKKIKDTSENLIFLVSEVYLLLILFGCRVTLIMLILGPTSLKKFVNLIVYGGGWGGPELLAKTNTK